MGPWDDLMSAVELLAEANRMPDSAIFFLNILTLNQHPEQNPIDVKCLASGDITQECTAMVVALSSEPEQVKRGWIWKGVALAIEDSKGMFLGDKNGIIACNQPFADGAWVCGHVDAKLVGLLSNFDIRECECGKPEH